MWLGKGRHFLAFPVRAGKLINYVFFFNDTATTEIYTLSLHDALPISRRGSTSTRRPSRLESGESWRARGSPPDSRGRSTERVRTPPAPRAAVQVREGRGRA